jgi:probable F420-dependent oxidoreductase
MSDGVPNAARPPAFGVILPTNEIGNDPDTLVRFAQAAERAGFSYLAIFDHVVGADPSRHSGWDGPYDVEQPFHEPFVVLAYLAATCSLEMMTAVLVLPQRQATLVAKQAAELDVLTGGRCRLGVGTGWNELEYRALNVDFSSRPRRFEEQIAVMRALWSEPVVDFHGEFHDLDGVGIRPLPVQRPIPIWLGTNPAGAALRRVGRLADGWICRHRPDEEIAAAYLSVRAGAEIAGRDPDSVGLQGMVQWGRHAMTAEDDVREVQRWLDCGASRISFSGARSGRTPEQHIDYVLGLEPVLRRFA